MSFSPDKRAESVCNMYDEHIEEIKKLGGDLEKYESLFLTWLSAESRCANWAITGPARFPVERNKKRMEWAVKHWDKLAYFMDKLRNPKPIGPMRTELDYGITESRYEINGTTVYQNTEANHIQILFTDKPSIEMISKLKSKGFKWSPRFKAWQRQLTPNAVIVTKWVLS